jgi:hypothetical protein
MKTSAELGANIMNSKCFRGKNGEKMAIMTRNAAIYERKNDHNLWFSRKSPIFV